MKKIKITETKIYLTNSNDADLSCRNHTARKNYQCISCQNLIEKRSEYTKTVGIYDGYFFSNPWHVECHKNHQQYLADQLRKE